MKSLQVFFAAALALAAVSAALILSACTGSSTGSVSVSLREFSFTPETFSVPAGSTVTLTLRNLGALEHNFHLMELGYVVEESWSEEDEAGTLYSHANVPGGAVLTATFIAPEVAGEYQILCSVPSHFELGMQGTLTVIE
jgi:uncharacterized cupredoxin-like copper-binding protein